MSGAEKMHKICYNRFFFFLRSSMSKTEIKVFYGIHGGIVSGVYETLESCVESRGQYKAFDNFFDAHTFACTGKMPEDLKDTKDNTSLTESLKEKEDKKEDVTKEHDIKEGVAASLRQIADSLEKEQFEDDKLDEGKRRVRLFIIYLAD